jgi:hypothetical protein
MGGYAWMGYCKPDGNGCCHHCPNDGPPKVFGRFEHCEGQHQGRNNQQQLAEAKLLECATGMQEILNVFGCQQKEDRSCAKLGHIQAGRDKSPNEHKTLKIGKKNSARGIHMNLGPKARRPGN